MASYSIGIDFGTLSGRALLIDVETGEELASSVYEYPHGVMDRELPCGKKLPQDWALQHPQDYLDVLFHVAPPCFLNFPPWGSASAFLPQGG